MILYRHKSEISPPEVTDRQAREGTHAALCHQSHDGWNYAGVADPVYFQPKPDGDWRDIDGGWQAQEFEQGAWSPALDLSRLAGWAKCLPVKDMRGREWLAPIILLPSGARGYTVKYQGADFLPALTPEQLTADTIASEALNGLSIAAGGEVNGAGLPIRAICAWTAKLLSITHHVSPVTLAQTGLIDGDLALGVLMVAAGLDARFHESGHGS